MSAPNPIDRAVIGRRRRSRSMGPSYNTALGANEDRYDRMHGKDEDEFVPQVPRIPERFRPHEDNHDCPSKQNTEQESGEYFDWKTIPLNYTRYLPNCSFGKSQKTQVISTAMMQAYVSMRGNYTGVQGNDPLFDWIQQREELREMSGPKIHEQNDVSRMLGHIDDALESSNPRGHTPRDYLFEIYRPDYLHIKPPQDMDMSPHIYCTSCKDFEWDDSDDEEQGMPSGRISPCTFREWSKGCVRWNGDVSELKQDTSSFTRMRPPTPEVPESPQQHQPSTGACERQWDLYTGEELSPSYAVPNCPSIIYTAPGVDFSHFYSAKFHGKFRRMLPLVERELRKTYYGGEGPNPGLSEGEKDRFSPSEVAAATGVVPEFHSRPGPEIEAMLQRQWAALLQTEATEIKLYKHEELQTEHIKRLQYDKEHLDKFLPALQIHREMHDQKMREKKKRDAKIRAYVAQFARDTQSRFDLAYRQLNTTQAKVSENLAVINKLEREIHDICTEVGVRDAEHAYAVLLGTDTLDGEEEYDDNIDGIGNDDIGSGNVRGDGDDFAAPNGHVYGFPPHVPNAYPYAAPYAAPINVPMAPYAYPVPGNVPMGPRPYPGPNNVPVGTYAYGAPPNIPMGAYGYGYPNNIPMGAQAYGGLNFIPMETYPYDAPPNMPLGAYAYAEPNNIPMGVNAYGGPNYAPMGPESISAQERAAEDFYGYAPGVQMENTAANLSPDSITVGSWTPSAQGRAVEEFNRYTAEMQKQDAAADGSPNNITEEIWTPSAQARAIENFDRYMTAMQMEAGDDENDIQADYSRDDYADSGVADHAGRMRYGLNFEDPDEAGCF
ncbi:hypothetical protein GGS21DRAFT_546435 [Xylaria nigripes]|nr:hypothetical protein GGS21DRAFT_546435 [Xylaria nigripes]